MHELYSIKTEAYQCIRATDVREIVFLKAIRCQPRRIFDRAL